MAKLRKHHSKPVMKYPWQMLSKLIGSSDFPFSYIPYPFILIIITIHCMSKN